MFYDWQMNLPSSLFPSIDLTYIEDKYSGLSKQALFNAWSSLKGNKEASPLLPRYNETEVYSLFKLILMCKNWLSAGCAFKQNRNLILFVNGPRVCAAMVNLNT
jgi:hypothetical protein